MGSCSATGLGAAYGAFMGSRYQDGILKKVPEEGAGLTQKRAARRWRLEHPTKTPSQRQQSPKAKHTQIRKGPKTRTSFHLVCGNFTRFSLEIGCWSEASGIQAGSLKRMQPAKTQVKARLTGTVVFRTDQPHDSALHGGQPCHLAMEILSLTLHQTSQPLNLTRLIPCTRFPSLQKSPETLFSSSKP